MAETTDLENGRKGDKKDRKSRSFLGQLKLGIHLRDKTEERATPADKKAAEFLAGQCGEITKSLDCSPRSGISVAFDSNDEPTLQLQIPPNPNGDEVDPIARPTDPASNLNLEDLYKSCFKAKKSYETALNAFLDYENRKLGISDSRRPGDPGVAVSVSGSGPPPEKSYEEVEDDIRKIEKDIGKAVNKLHGVTNTRKKQQSEQLAVIRVLRKTFHTFAQNAKNMHSYVSLVPKSAGFGLGGLICGGISIVLKAAERYELMDKNMQHALKGIKEALVHKAYVYERQEPDKRMHQLISDLFADIFTVLELLICWIFQKATVTLTARMEHSSTALGKCSRDLELNELKSRVKIMSNTVDKTHGSINKVLQKQTRGLKLLEDISGGEDVIIREVSEVGDAVQERGDSIEAQLEVLKNNMEQIKTQLHRANVNKNIFVLISQDSWQSGGPAQVNRLLPSSPTTEVAPSRRRDTQRIPSRRQRRTPIPEEPDIDTQTLLRSVGYQADLVAKDCYNIVRGARLDPHDERIAIEMTNHIRLRAFVENQSNCVLFVEGGIGARHETRGPVTLVVTKIVAALSRSRRQTNPPIYALAYFCSEHRDRRSPFGSAQDLAITLLLQLIEQHGAFDAELLQECRDAIIAASQRRLPNEEDTRAFCDLLERCVIALPEDAIIYCVVEGLAFFEEPKQGRREQMQVVVECLLRLGRGDDDDDDDDDGADGRARVKCLFTTPARSPVFINYFEPYEVLTLQNVNSTTFARRNSWIRGRN